MIFVKIEFKKKIMKVRKNFKKVLRKLIFVLIQSELLIEKNHL